MKMISNNNKTWTAANWPAPTNIRALTTTRNTCGNSPQPYASCNLGLNTPDDPKQVNDNRNALTKLLELNTPPIWLNQVHGTNIHHDNNSTTTPTADACITCKPGRACAVLTADCVPVIFCDQEGSKVAAAHCGWRGLDQQLIAKVINTMNIAANKLLAWIGPCIGPSHYTVDTDFYNRFVQQNQNYAKAFQQHQDHWLADLKTIAIQQLQAAGVAHIYSCVDCTYTDATSYYSYRRDGQQTGRMATLIWIDQEK